MENYYTDILEKLVGKTIKAIVFDDDTYGRYHGLVLKAEGKDDVIMWMLSDEEGNRPGFPSMEEVLT